MGLGQIGEFAFLLLSQAKRLKLLPKRLYLLTLGTTALTLLLTPVQWKVASFIAKARHKGGLGQHLRKSLSEIALSAQGGARGPEEASSSVGTEAPRAAPPLAFGEPAPIPAVAAPGANKNPPHVANHGEAGSGPAIGPGLVGAQSAPKRE